MASSFINIIHSTIPVVYELFPHSKVLSKSIIEPNVTMRFNKLFCESNHPLQEGAICRSPWGTTLHAKWRVSMSDCSSFRVQDFLHSHLQRASLMCLILSHGRPASSLIESMSMPRSSITWVGPIVSSWAIGDPQIVNHDEEGAEICAALRFSWFLHDDIMQDMVHKANQQVINGNPSKGITKPSKLERGTT